MAVALIVAAGRGQRFGADVPKALVALAGRPLLQWSVDALAALPEIELIVVALPPGVQAPPGTVGVRGGAVRSESVRLALAASGAPAASGPRAASSDDCNDDSQAQQLVLVHDAARPLLTAALARATLAALHADASVDAAIAAMPVTDTIKRAELGIVRETLDRGELWAVQTPQAFRRGALQRALDVPDELLASATDDAWLIERAGGRVAIVASTAENLKVTTPLDLKLASLLLAER